MELLYTREMRQLSSHTVTAGMRAAIPTVLGYVSIGLAFGVVAAASDLSTVQVALMSLLVYGGSAQFAMVALFVAGEGTFSIVLTVFFVNLRNMLMSLHTATIFPDLPLWDGLRIGSLITDESYGVLLSQHMKGEAVSPAWMRGNNLASYASWVVATVLGSVLGGMIPSPERLGLDFALVSMFIGIFAGQLEAMLKLLATKKLLAILGSVLVAYLLLVVILPSSLAVLVATVVGCGMGVYLDDK